MTSRISFRILARYPGMCNYELQRNPAPHTAQFGVGTAAKQRRKHDPEDFAQELVLTPQTPFDLDHQVCGEAQVLERLFQDFDCVLCLAAIPCEALLRCAITVSSRFGVLFSVSFVWGHAVLLCF